MKNQINHLCHETTTSRSKKVPSEHFAIDMPMIATACPLHSYSVAMMMSWLLPISAIVWPKPCWPASWIMILKTSKNTCNRAREFPLDLIFSRAYHFGPEKQSVSEEVEKKKELGDGETHEGDGVDVVVETIGSKAHYASVNSKAEKSQDECSQKPHHAQGARPISPERHVEKKKEGREQWEGVFRSFPQRR